MNCKSIIVIHTHIYTLPWRAVYYDVARTAKGLMTLYKGLPTKKVTQIVEEEPIRVLDAL